MQRSFSTNAFTNKTLLYAINEISKIGYDGIEIVLDIPHAFLPLKKVYVNEIKKQICSKKLEISNLNANTVLGFHKTKKNLEKFEPSLSNCIKKLRDWRISYTKKAIDIAEIWDSPSISITSGILNQKNMESSLTNFGNSLLEIARYAEKKGILIAIEYEPGLLLGSSEDVWHIISKDFKNVGLNFDTCHATVLGENISSLIKKFKKKIFHTHISDCKDRIHYHLLPGLGSIDFKEMYNSLKQVNYDGFLTAELYTYSDEPEKAASDTFIYLQNLVK